ncbi:MAG TPA: DUF805 domain-containing protein [Caulobacteraceae bacterium]|nr:DUF805 domain-containing protein [Caulobacteraceae bacterium]
MMHLLFSFDGRIRRLHYWLGLIGASVGLCVLVVILGLVFGGGAAMMSNGGGNGAQAAGAGLGIVGLILYLAILVIAAWIGLALQIKRWHDRDKSWVWFFISFIPIVGPIWVLVECGFMDGTQGPNRFGPSPKGVTGPATAPAT